MPDEIKRHRGGQPGNQNARKHGFYSSGFYGANKGDLISAARVIGLEDELALLRAILKSVVTCTPGNVRLITQLVLTINRLVRTSQISGFGQPEDFERKRLALLFDLAPTFGLSKAEIIAASLGKFLPSK